MLHRREQSRDGGGRQHRRAHWPAVEHHALPGREISRDHGHGAVEIGKRAVPKSAGGRRRNFLPLEQRTAWETPCITNAAIAAQIVAHEGLGLVGTARPRQSQCRDPAHAGATKIIERNALVFQDHQHAQVGKPPCRTRAQGHPHFFKSDVPHESVQRGITLPLPDFRVVMDGIEFLGRHPKRPQARVARRGFLQTHARQIGHASVGQARPGMASF